MLDSARRNIVAQVMQSIAGREQQPAGQVFKNVKVLTDIPAAQLLTMMNEQYGRGLGVGCTSCHVPGKWESDEKKNKTVAREMQRLANRLNSTDLPAIPDFEKEFDKVTCVTCHRGSQHPASSMPVPPPSSAPGSGR